ncbi:MAG: isoleucine--tRNA ligase [Patescibacteria group bacterium]|nr:isoleucine--tRNA ligase [Patescibacteria group bacterium]
MAQTLPEVEEKVIDFWQKNRIFEKSVENRPQDRHYVFYDGPPFATGLPHYGHLLGSTLKDVMPRYWTMRGFRVERVWGWDCHGLPIENIVEKELAITGGKKGIEALGIDKFNEACRLAVLRFDKEWKKFITRIGRFVDMEHSYKTMDNTFMESVWWGFKKLWEKGLVYEGRRVILYCPRCATPLSDFEIAMDKSYRDVEDESVYVKFRIKNKESRIKDEGYILAWTTTPWTLPGNVALAVDEKADYVKIRIKKKELRSKDEELLILAKSLAEKVIKEPYEVVEEIKGKDLVGLEYEPLYGFLPIGDRKAFYVAGADFVSMEEGTGVVHTAVMYGEDDYRLGMELGLPAVPMLSDEGKFLPFTGFLAGKFFKQANPLVIDDLKSRDLLYREEKIVHPYPFCYRCDTPLFYNAVPAWFINIQKIKKELVAANEQISWHPQHFKHGQFKDILENSPDWNISRSRYWGNPMPIWVCESCQTKQIIGSVEELKSLAKNSQPLTNDFDLHRPYIDGIRLKCECGGEMMRIPDVFDCWVESGSMSFAAKHYPFENKEWFEKNYPADFIGEYVAQVRAWFNVLHRISVAVFGKPSFKNVSVTGTYLGTDGKKMSKSRGNFPDPMIVINKYGVDSLRFYMMGSSVMKAEDVIFSESGVEEARNQFINLYFNCFRFLRLYSQDQFKDEWPKGKMTVLDEWLIIRTDWLVREATGFMDDYDTVSSCKLMREYVSDLSTWYLRRSRDVIKDSRTDSLQVLATALIRFSKVAAPIIPFITEYVYKDLTGEESVHLANWPAPRSRGSEAGQTSGASASLMDDMVLVRKICELGHAQRKEKSIKVRQPLAKVIVNYSGSAVGKDLEQLILDEVNIKMVEWKKDTTASEPQVTLDTVITPELKAEGEARDLVRQIQDLRKEAGCKVTDRIRIFAPSWPKEFEDYIKKETLAESVASAKDFRIELI